VFLLLLLWWWLHFSLQLLLLLLLSPLLREAREPCLPGCQRFLTKRDWLGCCCCCSAALCCRGRFLQHPSAYGSFCVQRVGGFRLLLV
jgi:hypothetical protein